jgi:hypothetical protein
MSHRKPLMGNARSEALLGLVAFAVGRVPAVGRLRGPRQDHAAHPATVPACLMGTRNVTVSTAAQLVPGSNPNGFGDDVTVLNTGSATAYLTDQAPDSTTDGQPLSAGSSLTWTKGQPLWVIGPSSTTLVVSENTGPIFDAGAIAAQILAQGLAGQIATAINVIGVPAIESATVLEQFSVVTPAGFSPGLAGPAIDCSRYQSLRIYCSETYGIGGAYPPPRPYSITWYADAGGTIPVGEDAFNVPTGTNGLVAAASAVVSVPCRGPYFTINSQSVSVGPSTSGVHRPRFLPARAGPQVVEDRRRFLRLERRRPLEPERYGRPGRHVLHLGQPPRRRPVHRLADPPGRRRPVDARNRRLKGNVNYEIRDIYSNRFVYRRVIPAGAAQTFVDRIVLPNSPISVAVTVAGSTTNVNWTLVGVDRA